MLQRQIAVLAPGPRRRHWRRSILREPHQRDAYQRTNRKNAPTIAIDVANPFATLSAYPAFPHQRDPNPLSPKERLTNDHRYKQSPERLIQYHTPHERRKPLQRPILPHATPLGGEEDPREGESERRNRELEVTRPERGRVLSESEGGAGGLEGGFEGGGGGGWG